MSDENLWTDDFLDEMRELGDPPADAVIAVSEGTRADVLRLFDVPHALALAICHLSAGRLRAAVDRKGVAPARGVSPGLARAIAQACAKEGSA